MIQALGTACSTHGYDALTTPPHSGHCRADSRQPQTNKNKTKRTRTLARTRQIANTKGGRSAPATKKKRSEVVAPAVAKAVSGSAVGPLLAAGCARAACRCSALLRSALPAASTMYTMHYANLYTAGYLTEILAVVIRGSGSTCVSV
jgi:hypothetical protein